MTSPLVYGSMDVAYAYNAIHRWGAYHCNWHMNTVQEDKFQQFQSGAPPQTFAWEGDGVMAQTHLAPKLMFLFGFMSFYFQKLTLHLKFVKSFVKWACLVISARDISRILAGGRRRGPHPIPHFWWSKYYRFSMPFHWRIPYLSFELCEIWTMIPYQCSYLSYALFRSSFCFVLGSWPEQENARPLVAHMVPKLWVKLLSPFVLGRHSARQLKCTKYLGKLYAVTVTAKWMFLGVSDGRRTYH